MTVHVDHVVVGLDDSEGGRAALRFALRDAVRRGACVEVVTAFRVPEHRPGHTGRPARPAGRTTASVRTLAAATVEEALAELDPSAFPPPVTVLAVGGDAGEVLVHIARNADLLVVGSRGRGRIAGAVLGSVGLHCVLHAPCPVTVVHPAAPVAAAPDRRTSGTSGRPRWGRRSGPRPLGRGRDGVADPRPHPRGDRCSRSCSRDWA